MRYKQEPWRNRVLAGWSHNPYKKRAGKIHDPDVRATELAEQYIRRITQLLIEDYGVMPITGVEVNFAAYGVPEKEIVNYINQTTTAARKKLFGERPDPCAEPLEKIKQLPMFLPEPKSPNSLIAQKCLQYEYLVAELLAAPAFNYYLVDDFFSTSRALVREIHEDQLARVNPEFQSAMEQYCNALIRRHIVVPEHGAISRVYIDDFTHPDAVDHPEITTPPRAPIVTVRQVNAIKRLLLESTYRFNEHPDSSPVAKRMRKTLGDIDIDFLHPEKYYNLAEQINFSLQTIPAETEGNHFAAHKAEAFHDGNLMNQQFYSELFEKAFEEFLPADRLATIGNRFPYDEETQRNDKKIHVRVNKQERVGGRVEICNFNDASSNIALSMLGVLSVAMLALATQSIVIDKTMERGEDTYSVDDVLQKMRELCVAHDLPKTPKDSVNVFKSSRILSGIFAINKIDALARGIPEEKAKIEATQKALEFEKLVVERQRLLLKQPWGGKARAEQESSKGWNIANPKKHAPTSSMADEGNHAR